MSASRVSGFPIGAAQSSDTSSHAILRRGSKSFSAASLLLPRRLRAPVADVYAFCRVADDAVDLGADAEAALHALHARLDGIYQHRRLDDPLDGGFARVVHDHGIPREVPLALLEGFRWDAEGRRYATLDELLGYCVRVASSVGVMLTLMMGRRERHVLARAADLGIAMQLTNICRDVGEDARAGRIYLPTEWLCEAGVPATTLARVPRHTPELAAVVRRTLSVADAYYARANAGIAWLPRDCRLAIRAASLIYSDIGRVIAATNYDSISRRAMTSSGRKAWLLARSSGAWLWARRHDALPPAEPARELVDAARGTS